MRVIQSGKSRTYIQREKLSRRLSFFVRSCGREERGESWKGLWKVKVVGDREAEICSVRKDVAGVVVLAGWRRKKVAGGRKVWCPVKK